MDLSKYNPQQLKQLKKDIDKELNRRRKEDVKEAQKELKNIAERFGITVQDLVAGAAGVKTAKKPAQVKFRHPDDPSKGWSGRGRKPSWIKEWEQKGRSLDALKVD
ncbi:DNA-binding protein H-NS [Natronocella acetinitrilica]|uniref:DNA-binding protein H-NS n=1 Tax=Natronocella acetinitrilica TaxID=414046 RepID=A0AAE3G5T0_9GAMM|nr:H-NS histone family protein [Natronocella acetinitrilica]MCP1676366.1 DNA-binding protein H-NS [Natronocella acetinitrilica]